ncbi:hypothetical protein [Klebsiella oxytoca]|uniref:hypothetical protein n=1 Tax=Klebsiella oxytoca TaxID=571 RepID=UPI002246E5F8|nr:hypothetical protein [Klebsiella oxytoca]MCW9550776.1 hypothetical protein [Klebsiella oxytoca]
MKIVGAEKYRATARTARKRLISLLFKPLKWISAMNLWKKPGIKKSRKMKSGGIMNKVTNSLTHSYKTWLAVAEQNGAKLIAYNCPACLEKLKTIQPQPGEYWDTFSTCPFCQALLFKITKVDKVEVELITKIGSEKGD